MDASSGISGNERGSCKQIENREKKCEIINYFNIKYLHISLLTVPLKT